MKTNSFEKESYESLDVRKSIVQLFNSKEYQELKTLADDVFDYSQINLMK